MSNAGTVIFVYNVTGQLIAEYADGPASSYGTRYLTADNLGTPRVITNSNAVVTGRHDYLAFGEEIPTTYGGRSAVPGYISNDTVRQQFTSKERDNETELDYFLARYYSSMQGRFTSVDPENAGADVGEPQSWNGYAYCLGEQYEYDSAGNLTRDRDGQTYVSDAENKIISFNGGASQGGADYLAMTADMPERAGGLTMTKKGAVAARTAAVKRRTFTREFKLKVIREVEAGKSQAQVAREYQITENTISKWRRQQRQYQDRAFAGRGHAHTDEARMHELERMVGGSPWRMTF